MFSNKISFSLYCRIVAAFVMLALVCGSLPLTVFAEDATSTPASNTDTAPLEEENSGAENTVPTEETNEEDESDDSATSTEESTDLETASSTDDVGDSATTTDEINENDGVDGVHGSTTPDVATSTSGTATTTDPGDGGDEGDDGDSGDDGGGVSATSTSPTQQIDPIPVVTDGLIGDTDNPEDEDVTGGYRQHSRYDITINTGQATAQGEIFTEANSNNVKSIYDAEEVIDLDFYTFNATGTSHANISNEAAALGSTGENTILTYGEGTVRTGNAIAAFNIANVVNSNIINSEGYLYLGNQILEPDESLNLQNFFFPEAGGELEEAQNCSLMSCFAEDIVYNVSQMNHATITNKAYIEAITGYNDVDGDRSEIVTGDAYGAANVVNVVNTNVIDSNYRLLTFNAIGDLDGDLILPTEQLFEMFFGLPNGTNQLEDVEDFHKNVDNDNSVFINNNVETYAESGQNDMTAADGDITTGNSESESNILNKVNENVYGSDHMYLWIRVHGHWSGDVIGLPEGLTWMWTSDGVIIYNEDVEIEPSEFLGVDIDSYTANIHNDNRIVLDNDINIDAISGENIIDDSLVGNISTGDTFASANVMNIANTNVIGANWMMAIVNVMGDFNGNVTFAQTDLTLTGDAVVSDDPLGRGSVITFTYTVANSSDEVATNVIVRQALDNAHISGGSASAQSIAIGDLNPGESKIVDLIAVVDDDIPEGTSTIRAVATVESSEGDSNSSDNTVIDTFEAFYASTTPDSDTDETSSITDQTGDDDTVIQDTGDGGGGSDGPSGGCGNCGKGSKTKTNSIDRTEGNDDPNRAPFIVLRKKSDVDPDDPVKAGTEVNYTITLTNHGGTAYDATLFDVLTNPIGAVLSEQSWDLGTILANEVITLEYTTTYDAQTPSGIYTNTASIEVYRHETSKEEGVRPLRLEDAVHSIQIDGVPLAVGNVEVLAYYPGANGVNALVTWETNKPATGQVLYSEQGFVSVYSPLLPHFGYQNESYRFLTPKTKHYMIVRGLKAGTQYRYKIRSTDNEDVGLGGDYFFTVPASVHTLTLAFPLPTSRVAGAATAQSPTVSKPAPTVPTTPVPAYVPPAPVQKPEPEPQPESEPEPDPEPVQQSTKSDGFLGKVFGFFR